MEHCPVDWSKVPLEPKFKFTEFMGIWYEAQYYDPGPAKVSPEKFENMLFRLTKTTSSTANVQIVATRGLSQECFVYDSSGSMKLEAETETPAKMKFVYSQSGERDTHMYVVDTDYDTYAVVIQCPWDNLVNSNCTSGTQINVLTRQKILINEFRVRKLVTEELCRDYDNGMYDVIHLQDCTHSGCANMKGKVLFLSLIPIILLIHRMRTFQTG